MTEAKCCTLLLALRESISLLAESLDSRRSIVRQAELVQRVRAGEEVVLRESHTSFLLRTLGPMFLLILSGVVLGLMKGGFWWGLAALGGVAILLTILWVPFRKVPQAIISRQGIEFAGNQFDWDRIETIGADSAEYVPDWIYLVTSSGNTESLGSTFGLKKELLRDALNELLTEYHPGSARADFEAVQQAIKETQDTASSLRFRRPTGPDDALQQARALLSSYYHPDCDTETKVDDRVIRIAALDPHSFPLHETDCIGCGTAPMKEVVLKNGQSLYEMFSEMQKLTPVKAQLGKFFLFSVILGPLLAIVGLALPIAKNSWLPGILGGGAGFLLGIIVSLLMYRPLRKAGFLW